VQVGAARRVLDNPLTPRPLHRIAPQVKILIRRRNTCIPDPHLSVRFAARVKRHVVACRTGFLGITLLSRRSCKENRRLVTPESPWAWVSVEHGVAGSLSAGTSARILGAMLREVLRQ
jgi:hypothetical protein